MFIIVYLYMYIHVLCRCILQKILVYIQNISKHLCIQFLSSEPWTTFEENFCRLSCNNLPFIAWTWEKPVSNVAKCFSNVQMCMILYDLNDSVYKLHRIVKKMHHQFHLQGKKHSKRSAESNFLTSCQRLGESNATVPQCLNNWSAPGAGWKEMKGLMGQRYGLHLKCGHTSNLLHRPHISI